MTSRLLTIEKLLPPHLSPSKPRDSDHIHLTLGRGEVFVIFGPKGSGKGRLLACLAGLHQPRQGRILYRGKPLSKPDGRAVGIVPRVPGVYEELEVWDYLEYFADVHRVDDHYRYPMITWVIDLCDLKGRESEKIATLPFALRKKLSLARAIIADPDILCLDDPFYRLERSQQAALKNILTRVRERGTTIIATAPSLGEFSEIASFLCVLTNKRVLAYGPTDHLQASLSCFKMMQVQFESGFQKAIRVLNEHPHIHHLSISGSTANLVRFLFRGTDQELTTLLRTMAKEDATIVSYVEDQEFLGRGGRQLPR